MGHLSGAGTQLLQEWRDLGVLSLAVCDQDAQEVLAAISAVHVSLPRLHILWVFLVLSGVDERLLEEAAQIAQLLQPTQRPYRSISFPGSSMKADVWPRCLHKLANAGVTVMRGVGIAAPRTSPIKEEEQRELHTLARTRMLRGFIVLPGELLW
ncbi:hypothetical protein O3P69_015713 [Scylla paramamosain]|uniref:Uncharacterized protein n=1 Tax=Scylla paramamosain TaxID=85552 RepID=A0AAW0S9S7_SCYPA